MGLPRRAGDPAELRKSLKPLLEKRRRARINESLSQLKGLILPLLGREEPIRGQRVARKPRGGHPPPATACGAPSSWERSAHGRLREVCLVCTFLCPFSSWPGA
uniref:Hes family bHLH transcription factor 2 n=1 Tax=Ovis aries TaxID=9940 RepID=A0AC11D5F7_SHEEP